jgi:hypothetical protein
LGEIARTKPFVILFPGEKAAGGRHFFLGSAPASSPLTACAENCFAVRKIPSRSFAFPVQYPYPREQHFSFDLDKSVFGTYNESPAHYDFDFKRLSVKDLQLEKGKTVRGNYHVYQNGRRIVWQAPTQTGVDLPAGTYPLEVFGSDADKKQYFFEEDVTL